MAAIGLNSEAQPSLTASASSTAVTSEYPATTLGGRPSRPAQSIASRVRCAP